MIDTSSIDARLKHARKAELMVIGILKYWGNDAKEIGQECWLPKWVHTKIRYSKWDGAKAIRHFPDIDAGFALVQVKSAPNGEEYPTLTIEEESFDVCIKLSEHNIPVLIVWLVGEKKLLANWSSSIEVEYPDTPREETNGSHTPYYIVRKSCLRDFVNFKDQFSGW